MNDDLDLYQLLRDAEHGKKHGWTEIPVRPDLLITLVKAAIKQREGERDE